MSYSAYTDYKGSFVGWLSEVPEHWNVCRIKDVAIINPAKSEVRSLDDTHEVSFIPMESIGENGELDVTKSKQLGEVLTGYTYVANGDVMIAKITPCFENGKGAIAEKLINGIGFATTEVIPVRPYQPDDAKFLYYLLKCNPFKSIAESSMYGAGGQKRVADSFVAKYHCALPSSIERIKIANFLDRETAKIDTLIDKQQQLIKLLQEKRQAVTSHAVTKGLNPDAKMKDSGVDWLGEVPEHWEVKRLKRIARMSGGYAFKSEEFVDSGIQLIRIGNVYMNKLSLERQPVFLPKEYEFAHQVFVVGNDDILMSLTGTLGKRDYGFAVRVETSESFLLNQRVGKIMPNGSKVQKRFLMHCLHSDSYLNQIYSLPFGTKQANLSNENVLEAYITYPSDFDEQKSIGAYISSNTKNYNALINKANDAISLIRERRTALISAAVTGKIDVRNVA